MPAAGSSRGARREVSAGGVVFRQGAPDPEFVLIKADGRWSLPKGNIEKGETEEAAALREISEETGLPQPRLRVVGRLPDVEYVFRWGGVLVFKTVHNFLVNFSGDAPLDPQLAEIDEVAWFPAAVARQTISFKNARATLDAAITAVEALFVAS